LELNAGAQPDRKPTEYATEDYELIGPRCIVKEDGQLVHDAIHPALMRGEMVTLNFMDVTQSASSFFNFAIEQLLKDIGIEDLRRRLQIENVAPDTHSSIE